MTLPTNFTNDDMMIDVHPDAHNDVNDAVNDLTASVDALSAFVEGSGAPGSTDGAVGDYYLDATNHVLYGAKVAAVNPAETITSSDGTLAGTYGTYGFRVRFTTAGTINRITYRRHAAADSTLAIQVWSDTGNKLREVFDTRASGVGRFTIGLPTPLPVAANQVLVFAISGNTAPVPATTTVTSTAHCTFLEHRGRGLLDVFPDQVVTAGCQLEPEFLPGTSPWPTALVGANEMTVGRRIVWENDSLGLGGATTEKTLATYVIPANSVVLPGGYKWIFHVHALCSQSSGAAATLTLRTKLNGTTSIGTSTMSMPSTGPSEHLVDIEWTLLGDNDYNLNQQAKFRVSGVMTPPTATDDLFNRMGYTRGNSVVQATWQSDITLTVTAQWSTATNTLDLHGYEVMRWLTAPG